MLEPVPEPESTYCFNFSINCFLTRERGGGREGGREEERGEGGASVSERHLPHGHGCLNMIGVCNPNRRTKTKKKYKKIMCLIGCRNRTSSIQSSVVFFIIIISVPSTLLRERSRSHRNARTHCREQRRVPVTGYVRALFHEDVRHRKRGNGEVTTHSHTHTYLSV